ncbi:MAG: hypothetical protein ACREUU_21545, partial [Gammaproteobacteria bacterium]
MGRVRHGKTALRAGYSVNFVNDEMVVAVAGNLGANGGLSQGVTASGLRARASTSLPPIPAPVFKVPRTFNDNFSLNRQTGFNMPDPNLRTPYVQQYTLGIQHDWKGFVIDARYVGNHGTKLYRGVDYNQVRIHDFGFFEDFMRARNNGNLARAASGVFNPDFNPSIPGSQRLTVFPLLGAGGSLGTATIRNLIDQGQVGDLASTYQIQGQNGPFSFFPNAVALATTSLSNYSNSSYNALQIDVRSRVRAGLQFQANYTYSKVLSDAAAGSENDFQNRIEAFLDERNPKIERARAPFDLTHAIKANYFYSLPLGPGHRLNVRGLGRLLGGWSTSGVLTWQSGTPFSILSARGTLNRGGRSGNNTATTT